VGEGRERRTWTRKIQTNLRRGILQPEHKTFLSNRDRYTLTASETRAQYLALNSRQFIVSELKLICNKEEARGSIKKYFSLMINKTAKYILLLKLIKIFFKEIQFSRVCCNI
jgi:hypothetical protein